MGSLRLDSLFDFLASNELFLAILWLGLGLLTITLLVMMQTRWGQSRPLRKCIVLSLLAHLLLAGYATTVQIVAAMPEGPGEPVIRVTVDQGPNAPTTESEAQKPTSEKRPWESLRHESVSQPEPIMLARVDPEELPEPERTPRLKPDNMPDKTSLDHLPLTEADKPEPKPKTDDATNPKPTVSRSTEQIKAPEAQRRQAPKVMVPVASAPERSDSATKINRPMTRTSAAGVPSALLQHPVPLPRMAHAATTPDPASALAGLTDVQMGTPRAEPADAAYNLPETAAGSASNGQGERLWQPSIPALGGKQPGGTPGSAPPAGAMAGIGAPQLARSERAGTDRELPTIYKLRMAPDRSRQAQRRGATTNTEAAVKAAMKWLADCQAPDGRWNARGYGAGNEPMVAGRNRQNAGTRADTGMTGLALLVFLASGHTHQEGLYQTNVRRGMEFLLKSQAKDGNLAGGASTYAAMYCHAMATFALSEGYAMSGDHRLAEPVRRAIGFTIAAQDPSGGGWRYVSGDPGDTSQLGWQLMALKSAELAGIPIPQKTRIGASRFLESVSSGPHRGLAAYRPGQQASRPMTAEALVCRQFLGLSRDPLQAREAGDAILGEMPGDKKANLYYWYYATLGMYQLQGEHWQRWNNALRTTLVESQVKTGPMAGSWDPNTVWGGYGGRIYSTALSALCLEVYYRFLPLYVEATSLERRFR